MNTYEVELNFEPVLVTVKANDEEEALDIAAERYGGCPDVDYCMSDVELVSEGEDEDNDEEEDDEPLSGQQDLFGGEK